MFLLCVSLLYVLLLYLKVVKFLILVRILCCLMYLCAIISSLEVNKFFVLIFRKVNARILHLYTFCLELFTARSFVLISVSTSLYFRL